MNNKKTLFMTQAAIIAAIYVVLVLIFRAISYGPIQVRVSEALTILPYFTPAAIPGITIGCFISNLLAPNANILDIVFGTLASFIAAILSYQLRRNKYLVPIPPIVVNALVIPWVIRFASGEAQPILFLTMTIGVGQLLSAGILGLVLLFALEKVKHVVFRNNN